ncbi:11464_t:CDS:1, partial [Racocetra persica]
VVCVIHVALPDMVCIVLPLDFAIDVVIGVIIADGKILLLVLPWNFTIGVAIADGRFHHWYWHCK